MANINISKFKQLDGLSEQEKKIALQILSQYANFGQSKLFEDLKYADFEEIPVDIETFIIALLCASLIFVKHSSNIKRIKEGKEKPINY